MNEPITTELRGKMGTLGWYDKDGIVAEYAAKLRLAGDDA